jgi:hypothetical protein
VLSIPGYAAAATVLVLLTLDATRDLTPIFVLLAIGVMFAWVLRRFVRPKK